MSNKYIKEYKIKALNTEICFVLIMFFVFFNSFSQAKKIDSLESLLLTNVPLKEKSNIYIKLSIALQSSETKKALNYSKMALEISKEESFLREQCLSYNALSTNNIYLNEYDESLKYTDSSMQVAKAIKHDTLIAHNYTNYAINYSSKDDYFKAFLNFDEALKIYRSNNLDQYTARTLANMSILFKTIKDYEKALEYALLNLEFVKKDNYFLLAYAHSQIGANYTELNDLKNANIHIKKAIELFEKGSNNVHLYNAYLYLGKIYFKESNYILADKTYKSVLLYAEKFEDKRLKMTTLYNYSELLSSQKKYKETQQSLNTAFKIAKKLKNNEFIFKISKSLLEVNLKLKEYGESSKYMNIHTKYKDSITKVDFYKGQLLHQRKESKYKNQKEIETIELKRDRTILSSIIFFSALILILILYGYFRLKKLYQKLKISDTAKNVFLTKITHEIKTPLNAIIGFSKLLKSDNLTEEDHDEYIVSINHSSKRLLKMSNNILDLTKAKNQIQKENVTLNNRSTDLNSLLLEKEKAFNLLASNKGIAFKLEYKLIKHNLLLDYEKLEPILYNLLSNALKFTSKGGVVFTVITKEITNDYYDCNFTIKDTGIGITTLDIEKIHQEFYQVVNNETDEQGVGLGLPLVNSLLQLMDSELKVESEKDVGSVFSFNLKLKKGERLKEKRIRKEIVEVEKYKFKAIKKILIVEDNKINMLLIKKLLQTMFDNILITTAYNGKEGVDAFVKEKQDLIIMDLQMPVLNGFEASKQIKELYKKYIPIIACSAAILGDKIFECKASGMDYTIEKPVDANKLKSTIIECLKINI